MLDRLGQHLPEVAHDAEVGDLEDRCLLVLVHGHDRPRRLHPRALLDGPGDPARDVELRGDGAAGLAHLRLGADPPGVHRRAGGPDRPAEGVREVLERTEVPARAAAAGHDHARLAQRRAPGGRQLRPPHHPGRGHGVLERVRAHLRALRRGRRGTGVVVGNVSGDVRCGPGGDLDRVGAEGHDQHRARGPAPGGPSPGEDGLGGDEVGVEGHHVGDHPGPEPHPQARGDVLGLGGAGEQHHRGAGLPGGGLRERDRRRGEPVAGPALRDVHGAHRVGGQLAEQGVGGHVRHDDVRLAQRARQREQLPVGAAQPVRGAQHHQGCGRGRGHGRPPPARRAGACDGDPAGRGRALRRASGPRGTRRGGCRPRPRRPGPPRRSGAGAARRRAPR